jgi:ribonuclease VapC
MFLDASVILANLLEEPEAAAFRASLADGDGHATSAIAMFEASTRLAVVKRLTIDRAYEVVCAFIDGAGVTVVSIGPEVGGAAHACAARYHHLSGHPARLNMGDCFAYAAARVSGLPLAYKGNDFVHTDIDGVRFGA